ncbi:MAG: hypothetical protein M3Z23_17665, partial [Acidobacteriota bacterium]|nr:hypothetical protein [Acidobacteriota bacterium]
MKKPFSRFAIVWLTGTAILSVAAIVYAREKNIPVWAAIPVAAAFLVEFPFYLLPGFENARNAIDRSLSRAQLALALCVSGLLPYLIYSLGTGQFRWRGFAGVAAIAATAAYWYVILPSVAVVDALFLTLFGVVILTKVFQRIYTPPAPHLPVDVLGHLMLIRLTVMVLLLIRRVHGIGFGWIPSRREFFVGLQYFLYFLPVGLPLAWFLGLLRFRSHSNVLWQVLAVGLGLFWVVSLSEEFLFRGVLQQWIACWTGSRIAALALTS